MSHPAHSRRAFDVERLRRDLRAVVGEHHVIDDPDVVRAASTDWTARFGSPAALLVRPAATEEVAAIVACCADAGAPVVPQGGNTGLVGGGVPRGGEVLVNLTRLDRLEVDDVVGEVVAGAGV